MCSRCVQDVVTLKKLVFMRLFKMLQLLCYVLIYLKNNNFIFIKLGVINKKYIIYRKCVTTVTSVTTRIK